MEIKIPFYNILNMFLTGLVFIGGCLLLYPDLTENSVQSQILGSLRVGPEIIFVVCVLAVAYEVGFIINRIGSVLVEPILKKTKIIPFVDDYKKYNDKKTEYPILDTLSREYALSRTSIALFLMLAGLASVANKCRFAWGFLLAAVLFILSCRKHSKKIVALIK